MVVVVFVLFCFFCRFKGSFYKPILLLVFIEPMSIFKFNLELPDAAVKCLAIRNVTYFSRCLPLTLPHCHCPPTAVDRTETPGKAAPSVGSAICTAKPCRCRVCRLYLAKLRIQSIVLTSFLCINPSASVCAGHRCPEASGSRSTAHGSRRLSPLAQSGWRSLRPSDCKPPNTGLRKALG